MSVELRGSRVLVTGGAGFIGSFIVDQMLEDGADQGPGSGVLPGSPADHPERRGAARAIQVMVNGTQNILEAARKHGVGKIAAASTASVYGGLAERGIATRRGVMTSRLEPF